MYFATMQDILAFVATIAIGLVAIFLCWALYEIAKLVRQANEMVTDTREKMGRVERLILSIGEKIGATSQYLGFIAEGGKQILSFLHNREEKADRKTKTKKKMKDLEDEIDEEEEEEE